MNNKYIFLAILIMAIVTIILRFIPFVLLSDKKEYRTLNYLSKVLPCVIMGMLVVYCFKDVSFTNAKNYISTLVASSVVSISYIMKRKTLLSIILGTTIYMLLLQFVF